MAPLANAFRAWTLKRPPLLDSERVSHSRHRCGHDPSRSPDLPDQRPGLAVHPPEPVRDLWFASRGRARVELSTGQLRRDRDLVVAGATAAQLRETSAEVKSALLRRRVLRDERVRASTRQAGRTLPYFVNESIHDPVAPSSTPLARVKPPAYEAIPKSLIPGGAGASLAPIRRLCTGHNKSVFSLQKATWRTQCCRPGNGP